MEETVDDHAVGLIQNSHLKHIPKGICFKGEKKSLF